MTFEDVVKISKEALMRGCTPDWILYNLKNSGEMKNEDEVVNGLVALAIMVAMAEIEEISRWN